MEITTAITLIVAVTILMAPAITREIRATLRDRAIRITGERMALRLVEDLGKSPGSPEDPLNEAETQADIRAIKERQARQRAGDWT